MHESGIPGLKEETRTRAADNWRRFPDLQRFLRDHYPVQWERIQQCTQEFKTYESRDTPGQFKLAPFRCHEEPFCINCVRAKTAQRVHKNLDYFHRCTPNGRKPRFIHIVQTAPVYHDGRIFTDQSGWGVQASYDPKKFAGIVWDTLREFYGDGIGAALAYQDFGERAFAKRHPHIDLTLNGWKLEDEKAVPIPYYDFSRVGTTRWDEAIRSRATRFRLDADYGNVHFGKESHSIAGYYGTMWYSNRELVDLRKIAYGSKESGKVYWRNYKTSHREEFQVRDFMAGLAEYGWRLGQWTYADDDNAMSLYNRHGHMAKGSTRKTMALMGGSKLPHGENCPCSSCGEWERVDIAEEWHPFIMEGETYRRTLPQIA